MSGRRPPRSNQGKTKARELPRSLAFATTSFLLDLPGKSHSQLQRAAAAIEYELIEELWRVDKDVAGVQRVGVGVLVERPVVARQTDAVVLMVKSVESLETELQRGAFRELHGFEHGHVPDVESRRTHGVSPDICFCPKLRLNEPCIRGDRVCVSSYRCGGHHVTDDVCVVFRAAVPIAVCIEPDDRCCSAGARVTHGIDHCTGQSSIQTE